MNLQKETKIGKRKKEKKKEKRKHTSVAGIKQKPKQVLTEELLNILMKKANT